MNENWEKGIEDLKKLKLSSQEKEMMLSRILTPSPYVPTVSVWTVFMRSHAMALSVFLVLVLGSGTLVASEGSLPGSLLYPLKTEFSEPARDLINILPRDSASWQAEKATRRLLEAEVLAVQDKLSPEKRSELEVLFDKHTQKFNEVLVLATSSEAQTLKVVEDNFKTNLMVHAEVLRRVNERNIGDKDEIYKFEQNVERTLSKNVEASIDQDVGVVGTEATSVMMMKQASLPVAETMMLEVATSTVFVEDSVEVVNVQIVDDKEREVQELVEKRLEFLEKLRDKNSTD